MQKPLKIVLFNPRSANSKPRIPNSILQIAASIDGKHEYFMVDGNMETDPEKRILSYFKDHKIDVFGCTVMPGPQLKQAIPISKKLKQLYPDLKIIWGGYFPSNQPKSVLNSGYIDYIVNGPGDNTFPQLLNAIQNNLPVDSIKKFNLQER